jgi:hypothetical protein
MQVLRDPPRRLIRFGALDLSRFNANSPELDHLYHAEENRFMYYGWEHDPGV